MTHQTDPLAHAHQTAQHWLTTVAHQLHTEDRHYTFRVVKAWLHLVRDRLTIDSAVHVAAQLPEFLRGVYYDGWVPSRIPVRYGADEFTTLFADHAGIGAADVPAAAGAVSAALGTLFSPGQLDHVFALMPASLRGELQGEAPALAPKPAEHRRLSELEDTVRALAEAVSTLARGLEQLPTSEPSTNRMAKAAQDAHRVLMAQGALRSEHSPSA